MIGGLGSYKPGYTMTENNINLTAFRLDGPHRVEQSVEVWGWVEDESKLKDTPPLPKCTI